MSSNSTQKAPYYDEITGYLDCIAQSDRDPDVQGYAVRLSTFIANVCLAILMTWSHEDVEESVYVIFMQVYTILLATFISLARRRMSIADAHFCLSITISPLSIYFVYSTARWLMNKRSNLYIRLGKSHKLITTLTCLMVIQWIVLEIIIYGAPDFVFEGQRCTSATLVGWLFYRIIKTTLSLDYSLFFFPVFPFFYIMYTLRHIFDIAREHKRHQGKVKRWRFFRFVQVPWMFVRSWTLSNWIVVTYSHQWMIFLLVFIAYLTWAGGVGVWIPSMPRYWNWVLQVIHKDEGGWAPYVADPNWDPLGFGQILAATTAIQPVYEVCKLTIRRRYDLWRTLAYYPHSFWNGVVFLVTGRRNSWKKILKEREERERNQGAPIEEDSLPLRENKYSLTATKDEEDVYSARPDYKRHDSSGSSYAYSTPAGTPYDPVFPQIREHENLGAILSMSPNRSNSTDYRST